MATNTRLPRIAFFGSPEFAAQQLRALVKSALFELCVVVTQPDRPAGRGSILTPPPVKTEALLHHCKVVQPRSIKGDVSAFLSDLQSAGPIDVAVVVAFGQILPVEVLEFPRCGCVNVHASLLPRWRGAAPIQRAILAGDTTTGICLMKMDVGLDTGPVYSREEIRITETTSYGSLHDELSALAATMLIRDLPGIARGEVSATPQGEEGTTYAKKILNDEAAINWSKSSSQIDRQIRGLSPFPGAFTWLKEKRLKITNAIPKRSMTLKPQPPGTVVLAERAQVEVQCGDGVLALQEVQLEGRARMKIEEFVKGSHLVPGAVLGETKFTT